MRFVELKTVRDIVYFNSGFRGEWQSLPEPVQVQGSRGMGVSRSAQPKCAFSSIDHTLSASMPSSLRLSHFLSAVLSLPSGAHTLYSSPEDIHKHGLNDSQDCYCIFLCFLSLIIYNERFIAISKCVL